MKKKLMAVVRGVQPRMSEINFYSSFSSFNIRFIGDKTSGWVIENKLPTGIEFVDLPLKPRWQLDPITTIMGSQHVHRSWQDLSGLEYYLEDVDIINISDTFYFYCGQCAVLAKKLNKKLVTIVWESVPKHPSTFIWPYSTNVRNVINNTDLFIARSHVAARYLKSIGADERKIRVVYKGIDTASFYPEKQLITDKIRILYVGQLVASKGVHELLAAFTRLSTEFPQLELWICARSLGEPLEHEVKNLAKSYPIKWFGRVPYDKLPDIYRQCQVYCQLSQEWYYFGLLHGGNEWFSYSILEAMASGLPIVTTNVGGLPEQVGDHNIIVNQKDIEATYNGLKLLIADPKKRMHIGQENLKRVKEKFDIIKQARETETTISKFFS